jgi:hypothetical protein
LNSELFGTPLPDTPILWLALFLSILGALATVLFWAERFLEVFTPGTKILRRYGGLLLPVGWATWSVLLLYWRFETATVLVVLLGTFFITTVAAMLVRRCQA